MDEAAVAVIRSHLQDDVIVHPYRDGVLVDLPIRYGDGEAVRLLVEPVGDGYRVSDRCQVADRLLVAGVSLSSELILDTLADVAHAVR